jgi:hypothetical protein
VVLVAVVAKMGEYHVRCRLVFQRLEGLLDVPEFGWEVAIPETVYGDFLVAGITQKSARAPHGFLLAGCSLAAEDDPAAVNRALGRERGQRTTTADLDIVGVRA